MPTNLYGPNDNFDLENSHVLAALIRKFHLAGLFAEGRHHEIKKDESLFGPVHREFFDRSGDEFRVKVWGSGNPCREFLHADDLAGACLFLMKLDDTAFSSYTDSDKVPLINIGCGKEITIKDLAHLIKDAVGFKGGIIFDSARPDGTHRKLLDITRIRSLGWEPVISLQDGIVKTYSYYLAKTNNGYGV
jgi:GDP-L-fucose synthase